jgi:hypothetical protein
VTQIATLSNPPRLGFAHFKFLLEDLLFSWTLKGKKRFEQRISLEQQYRLQSRLTWSTTGSKKTVCKNTSDGFGYFPRRIQSIVFVKNGRID